MSYEGEALASGEYRHRTHIEHKYAFERRDNWFWWHQDTPVFQTIPEALRPFQLGRSSHLSMAPITVYNDWPEKLSNASIFPYLVDGIYGKYESFHKFVKSYYQSSCAIVYQTPDDGRKIIGTGSLINNGMVATARHNFQDIPIESLYVRFFNYSVEQNNNGWLLVKERYLDMPVIKKNIALDGLDAGYLEFPALLNLNLFFEYGKVLPIRTDSMDALTSGQYAMFHFAGGRRLQVSVGEITAPNHGTALYAKIAIQAGPGASGAAVIWQGFDKILGRGISIYRMVDDYVDRRLISFYEFDYPGYKDKILAPYYYNPQFRLITSANAEVSGYEYVNWCSWISQYSFDSRPPHPEHFHYDVFDNHSNHHIIPIAALLFLWDYLNKLGGEVEMQLSSDINKKYQGMIEKRTNEIGAEIKQYYSSDERHLHWQRKKEDQKLQSINRTKELELVSQKDNQLIKQYGHFFNLFSNLIDGFPKQYKPSQGYMDCKNRFAWAKWNLFQGWGGDYRNDDPKNHQVDTSEKIKPLGFDQGLWSCIKDKQHGLFNRINNLKTAKTMREREGSEKNLYDSFNTLKTVWYDRKLHQQGIYKYDSNDWVQTGQEDGHNIYALKVNL